MPAKINMQPKHTNTITLIIAVIALALWAMLAFALKVTTGTVHVLLAIGVTLLIRWWAIRA